MKQCKLCEQLKDESEFSENKMLPDGLQAACRECVKKQQTQPTRIQLKNNRVVLPCCR